MVVVQAVILFRSETWVLTPRLEKGIKGFHHRVAGWMAVMGPKRQQYRMWVYPHIWVALVRMVLGDIWVYIACHQNMVAQYIEILLIMNLCLAANQNPGMRLSRKS